MFGRWRRISKWEIQKSWQCKILWRRYNDNKDIQEKWDSRPGTLCAIRDPWIFCNTDTLETGLSDFHKLIMTVLKPFFKK